MSELKLYEISEEYISYISTVKKMFFPQKKMTGTIQGSIWALYTALTVITITFPFPPLKILITECSAPGMGCSPNQTVESPNLKY